jgi:hypothetical protein
MDQHAGNFDHGDAIHHRVGRFTMLVVIVQHPTGKNAGTRWRDNGAFQGGASFSNLDSAPEDARTKAGEKRHCLGGLDQ